MEFASPIVCVVDDDDTVRHSIERLLKSSGYDALSFASANEFISHVSEEEPSCLVLDVRMPGLTGIELQNDLRSRHPDLPIVFVTGHGDIPMSVKAIKNGAVDFLQKPFEDHELLDAIRNAIEIFEARKSLRKKLSVIENRISSLTRREYQVFTLVVTGLLNKQIAGILGVTEKTIKVHRGRLMKKMEVVSLAELVLAAERTKVATGDIDLIAGELR